MSFKMNTRTLDGVRVVDCSGRLTGEEEAQALRDHVKNELAESQRLILNMEFVDHIDSAGLGAMTAVCTSARKAGGDLRLAAPSKRLVDLLRITKLVTVFTVHATVEEAVGAMRR
jgi:anti-sigma B factor antagonist